jgi:hypothetical protein
LRVGRNPPGSLIAPGRTVRNASGERRRRTATRAVSIGGDRAGSSLRWRRLRSKDGTDPSNPTSMEAGPIPHGRRAGRHPPAPGTRSIGSLPAGSPCDLRGTSFHPALNSKNRNTARAKVARRLAKAARTTGPTDVLGGRAGGGLCCFRPNRMHAVPPVDRTRLHRIFKRLGRALPGLPASMGGWPLGALGRAKAPYFFVVVVVHHPPPRP